MSLSGALSKTSKPGQNVSSMSDILTAPLNELQALSHTLFLSLSPAQAKPPQAPPLSAFLECDKALSDAVNLAYRHQMSQRRIEALEKEILQLESQWREMCMELEAGKRELEEIIAEGEERINAIEKARKGELCLNNIHGSLNQNISNLSLSAIH